MTKTCQHEYAGRNYCLLCYQPAPHVAELHRRMSQIIDAMLSIQLDISLHDNLGEVLTSDVLQRALDVLHVEPNDSQLLCPRCRADVLASDWIGCPFCRAAVGMANARGKNR